MALSRLLQPIGALRRWFSAQGRQAFGEFRRLNHEGHLRLVSRSVDGAPRIASMLLASGDMVVTVSGDWLRTAAPADVQDLAVRHFTEMQAMADRAGGALKDIGRGILGMVLVAEALLAAGTAPALWRLARTVWAAVGQPLSGGGTTGDTTPLAMPDLWWLAGLLVPPLIGMAVRAGISVHFRKRFGTGQPAKG